MNKIGVVSAGDASALDVLEAELTEKAVTVGANGHSIIPVINSSKLNDTAVIYR